MRKPNVTIGIVLYNVEDAISELSRNKVNLAGSLVFLSARVHIRRGATGHRR